MNVNGKNLVGYFRMCIKTINYNLIYNENGIMIQTNELYCKIVNLTVFNI